MREKSLYVWSADQVGRGQECRYVTLTGSFNEELFMNERPKSVSEIFSEEFNKAIAKKSPSQRMRELNEEMPSLDQLIGERDVITRPTKLER